jgi:aspartyl-tRNA(Asn)/glutamyl-tRNA(Gln) amidotransferase subunit A
MTEVCDLTGSELAEKLRAGELSAVELTESSLRRVEAVDGDVNAILTPTPEVASERAEAVDDHATTGATQSPVAGIPIVLKDVLATNGIRTTCGSKILENYIPPYDCTAWTRLSGAGAVLVGKTNCDEFAMGSSNENSAFGPVSNPWALDRIPGGSSGGSAAAVAARCVPLALGSDTGGSIRQPAACCGVVGLKPSYGRVSRYGLLAFASSLDQIGPFARTVADAALTLSVLAGSDPCDATTAREPVPDFAAALTGNVKDIRIGVPRAFVTEGVDDQVRRAYEGALDTLRAGGVTLVDIDLPHAKYAVPVYYLVCTAEASSNLARYDGVKYGYRSPAAKDSLKEMYSRTRDEGFGPEVKRRIMLGTYVLSAGYYDAFYLKALQVRTLLRRDYDAAFERADVVVMPTMPTPPFKLGEKASDPLQMYLGDIFTVSANLAGLPGISVPCGFSTDGLPIGFQLMGRMFDEATVLRVADAYERSTDWHRRSPPL